MDNLIGKMRIFDGFGRLTRIDLLPLLLCYELYKRSVTIQDAFL